eukprot:scaffold313192_cov34-Prasinocladus_malaysianus.AAC.1
MRRIAKTMTKATIVALRCFLVPDVRLTVDFFCVSVPSASRRLLAGVVGNSRVLPVRMEATARGLCARRLAVVLESTRHLHRSHRGSDEQTPLNCP